MLSLEVLIVLPLTAEGSAFVGSAPPLGEVVTLVIVGFFAGVLGGLLGIGGSIIMIPFLTLVPPHHNQHISQAAAMIVNAFVAVPSMIQHHRNQAVRWDAVWLALPAGLLFIIVGVEMSNTMNGVVLQRIFGAFLLYVVYMNCVKLFSKDGEPEPNQNVIKWWSCGFVGTVTGSMAGLLGIGGGVITVPLLQRACKLPLRQCIATSAAIMILTAIVGAIRKNMALSELSVTGDEILLWQDSVVIAMCFIPTAIVGGWLGAKLTHILKIAYVRLALIVLLSWAAWQMLGIMGLFGN